MKEENDSMVLEHDGDGGSVKTGAESSKKANSKNHYRRVESERVPSVRDERELYHGSEWSPARFFAVEWLQSRWSCRGRESLMG